MFTNLHSTEHNATFWAIILWQQVNAAQGCDQPIREINPMTAHNAVGLAVSVHVTIK